RAGWSRRGSERGRGRGGAGRCRGLRARGPHGGGVAPARSSGGGVHGLTGSRARFDLRGPMANIERNDWVGNDLTERERQVLDAVVRTYVASAEPTGSRTLSRAF